MYDKLWLIPFFPLLGSIINGLLGKRFIKNEKVIGAIGTGAVFLSCEFVMLTGPFAKRKIWSNVGLHSNKGPTWAQMGRSFIKAVLNSSRNIHPDDVSPEAGRARQIRSFGDLDGAEFGLGTDVPVKILHRGDNPEAFHAPVIGLKLLPRLQERHTA